MNERRWLVVLWALALAFSGILLAAALCLGELNQDEGWYLYAARLVSEGRLPYVDFASTQGPVMPFVYSLGQPLIARWGVAGGRFLTAVFGVIGAFGAAALAARLAPRRRRGMAALMAFTLIGVNVYQAYFLTVVKTYALASAWLVLGFLALSLASDRGGPALAALAGVLFALAAGTRASAGAVLPVVFFAMLFAVRRSAGSTAPRDVLPATQGSGALFWVHLAAFAAGAGLTLGLIFLPFAVKAPHALWFALVEYHAGRTAGGLFKALVYKGGFACRLAQAYAAPIGLLIAACVFKWFRPHADARESRLSGSRGLPWRLPAGCLWASVLGVTAIHFCTPFPYDDYQVMVFPVFAVALALMLARLVDTMPGSEERDDSDRSARSRISMAAAVLLLCGVSAAGSPMVQEWFVAPRDRIWWPLKKETPLAALHRAAKIVNALPGVRPGALLLTQDLYLAVEAGLRVPEGLELGPFSYFPDWSREKAERCHVLNRSMLMSLLDTCPAPAAAFSGYGLSIRSPDIVELPLAEQQALWQIALRNYTAVNEVAPFGQAGTVLRILTRNP